MIYGAWVLSLVLVICILKGWQKKRIKEVEDLLAALYSKNYQMPMKQDDFSILEDAIYKLFIEVVEEKEKVKNLSLTQSKNIEDIAHQIKTPIAGMLLGLQNGNLNEAILDKKLNRLNNLSNALLKLASLDANTEGFQFKRLSLKEAVEYALDILSEDIDNRNITIENRVGPEIIEANFYWLTEALINIIKNAVNLDKTTRITLTSADNAIFVELKINDNGGGITDDEQNKIFRRFYKYPDSDGFGIGLSMAKDIIEKHGGIISCSNQDGGAEFIIKFYK